MRTIFHKNRKRFDRPVYVRVLRAGDGGVKYAKHYSREERQSYECGVDQSLYRINVYPRPDLPAFCP